MAGSIGRAVVAALFATMMWGSAAGAQALEKDVPPCSDAQLAAAQNGAQQNDPAMTYLLARYYSTGKCGLADGAKAIDLYRKAASLNYPPAFYNLGIIAAAHQNFVEAEQMFLRGTELGHRGCELMLGILYHLSSPDVRDDTKAYAWLSFTASRDEEISSQAEDMLSEFQDSLKPDHQRAKVLIQQLKQQYGAIPAFVPKAQ